MLFEHKYAGVKEIDSRREALTIIAELCRAAENDIRPEVPALFARLVYKLRDLNAVSLRATYDEVVSRKMCRYDTFYVQLHKLYIRCWNAF